MSKPLPSAGFFETIRLLFGSLTRYRVKGDSMSPALKPGDEVAVDKNAGIKAGDIVVVRHPYKTDIVMIKRIDHFEEDGRLYLLSDNPHESSDSRTFGAVSLECVKGKAVAVLNR